MIDNEQAMMTGEGGSAGAIGAGVPILLPPPGATERIELLGSSLGNPWPLCYGRHIIGGNIIFQNVNDDGSTTVFVALGEGPWDALETLWVNGVSWDVADTARVHFHPGLDGATGDESTPGTPNQQACSFWPSTWSPKLTFSRIAYLALRIPEDPEAPDNVLDIRGVYRTRKVRVFDGSGTQTSFAYSASPAWCILDAIIARMIKPHASANEALTTAEKLRIDFQSFVDAAADCATDPGDGAALFEPHQAFVDSVDMARALDQMLLSCRGFLIKKNGKIALYIDQESSTEFTANRSNIAENSLSYPRKELRSLANHFDVRYRSLDSGGEEVALNFQQVSLPLDNQTHQDGVGRIIPTEIDLGNSTPGRAARLGNYLLSRSLLLAGQARLRLLQCADGNNPIDLLPGDWISAPKDADGWIAQDYHVLEITDEPDGSRECFLQTADADAYHSTLADEPGIYSGDLYGEPLNPSGASTLEILTSEDDGGIPELCARFRFNRDTSHYKTIRGVAVWLSAALPAYGPFATERSGNPAEVIESGTLTAIKGNPDLTVTRGPDANVIGRVLLIWTADGTPDSDLDGNVVVSQGTNSLRVRPAFRKSGDYSYAIIKRWWDPQDCPNLFYHWFAIDQLGDIEQPIWTTPPIPVPIGTWYATAASRGNYGLGARLTAGPATIEPLIEIADTELPEIPSNFIVTGANGLYVCGWNPPANVDGNRTVNYYAIQLATDIDFTAIIKTAKVGAGLYAEFLLPDSELYFRIAAHNRSGLDSDAGSVSLGAKGWGPFYQWPDPDPIQSGQLVAGEYDSVLPGAVGNFSVTCPHDDYVLASWTTPTTGNNTIDDYLIQYADDVNFSVNVITVPIGVRNSKDGNEANRTRYWRISAHNRSGILTGGGSGDAAQQVWHIGGWGPWTAFGSPTAVTTGPVPETGLDTVARGAIARSNTGLDSAGRLQVTIPYCRIPSGIRATSRTYTGPTTTRGTARNDVLINPADNNRPYYLDGHNLIGYSEQPNNAAWVKSNCSISWNVGNGPSSLNYASKLSEDDQNAWHYMTYDMSFLDTGKWVDFSFFAKAGERQYVSFEFNQRTSGKSYIMVNLADGSYSTSNATNPYVQDWGSGWFRISFSCYMPAGSYTPTLQVLMLTGMARAGYQGNGTSGLYLTGFQVEYNDQATEYDDTTGSTGHGAWTDARDGGAARGLLGLDSSGDLARDIIASRKIVGRSENIGTTIGRLGADGKLLTADDVTADGGSYVRVSANQRDGGGRAYAGLASNGDVARAVPNAQLDTNLQAYISSNTPNGAFTDIWPYWTAFLSDSKSAVARIYWKYADASQPCTQFMVEISDQSAYYIFRVKNLKNAAAAYHKLTINRLKRTKQVTVSITPEFIGAGGIVAGSKQTNKWNFTPDIEENSDYGGTEVGLIDWAGGNVWYETDQYRNNLAPTNGYSASGLLATGNLIECANQSQWTLTNLTYTQGANIATHLAIIIKGGGGTISLTSDAIVTLINLAALPSSYLLPYSLNDGINYTIGIAACALTRDGYSFNATFQSINITPFSAVYLYVLSNKHISIKAGNNYEKTVYIRGASLVLGAYDIPIAATIYGSLDLATYSAKLQIRQGSGSAWPTISDMANGELCVWTFTGTGTRLYKRDGTSMRYIDMSV